MSGEEFSGVPAGWYPDPLGLPQLRWWDNHSWTEHVAEARQPMVVREQTSAARDPVFADPDSEAAADSRSTTPLSAVTTDGGDAPATTRRARRARERTVAQAGSTGAATGPGAPNAQTLRQLSAPTTEPAEAVVDAPTASGRAATTASVASEAGSADRIGTGTAPVWIIALLPLLQLLIALLLVTGVGVDRVSTALVALWLAPYPVVLVLAAIDRRMLRRAGVPRPASWAWALLTAPVYLLARASRTASVGGRGFAPFVTFGVSGLVVVGAVLAVPGLLIATVPSVFQQEAQGAVQSQASIIGAYLQVECPAHPPVLVGQSFACAASRGPGDRFDVTVSLQRANGWVEWRVDDWGVYTSG